MLQRFFGRALCAPALLVLLPWSASAQPAEPSATLTGRAVTPTGEVVTRGTARLIDARRRVALDDDGRFTFHDLPADTYLVEVASEPGELGSRRVTVGAGETVDVEIVVDKATVSDAVVVTASPDARSQLEVAQPTTVLSGEELELRLESSLGETLNEQPGISSTYFGPGASRPVIRGLGGDRVRILESGIGTADVSNTSPDHAVASDPMNAERIEVVRGPATLLYGSSAVGGVVNVLDERIPSYVPESPLSGVVELLGGTVSNEATGSVSLEGGNDRWAWHADALTRETDDYEIPGGVLENSAVETESGAFGASYVTDRGFFGLSVSGYDTLYGVPGEHHEEGEDGGEEEAGVRIDQEQRRVDLKGRLVTDVAFLRGVKLRLGVTGYEHTELEGEETGTIFENDAVEGRFEFIQKRRGKLTGSFGLQVTDVDFSAVGEEAFVPPSKTESWAAFAFEELDFGATRFQFGARFETQDVDPEPALLPSRSFDGVSTSLGFIRDLGERYAVTASLARTERLPTANELYADGPHLATGTFEIGNVDLGKETSLGLDVSLRKRQGRVTGVLNFFTNRFDDYVFERFTGRVEDGLDVVRFTQADAEFRGVELDLVTELLRFADGHVDLTLRGDFVDAELTDTGEPLPRIPPLRYGAGVNVHYGSLRGTFEVRRVEEQDEVAIQETPTDGYTMLNASVHYRVFTGDFITDLHLKATNLTDELARNHTSFLKDEAPLPGRDLSLSVRFRF